MSATVENLKRLFKFGGIGIPDLIDKLGSVLEAQEVRIKALEEKIAQAPAAEAAPATDTEA